jgi:hypothetical protein
MKIHKYNNFINESSDLLKSEIEKFKATLSEYFRRRNVQKEHYDRALDLLNEIEKNNSLEQLALKWFTEGKTLVLMELMMPTTYNFHNLEDFNAFALIDTVGMYNRGQNNFEDSSYMDNK